MRNILNLPVPRAYAWSSGASENPLGAEYILTEKQDGVVLTDVWDTIKGKQKVRILDQVVDMEKRLTTTSFSKFGSLYYKDDLPENSDSTSLYIDSTGKEMWSEKFDIGPSFFEFGRGEFGIERAPCKFISTSCDIIILGLFMYNL